MRRAGWLWATLILLTASVVLIWVPPSAVEGGGDELRALWVTSWGAGFKSQQQVDQLLDRAEAGGINAIYAQVARRADAYYPSNVLPHAHDADPEFDALGALVAGAHARGMELHAWATTFFVWQAEYENADTHPDHVWHRHGPAAPSAQQWTTRLDNGGATHYLDPAHPDAVAFVAEMYLDIVRRYPVDGIHLDYIRYSDQQAGYNPTALARFRAATGFAGTPAKMDATWRSWRTEQLTHAARQLYLELLAERPELVVSAAVITGAPSGGCQAVPHDRSTFQTCSTAMVHYVQNWLDWADEGIFDLFVPMNYFREGVHAHLLDGWLSFQAGHAGSRAMVSGLGAFLNTLEQTRAQIERSRAAGGPFLGVSLFSYQGPAAGASQDAAFAALGDASGPLAGRPGVPSLPWKEAPTTGHILLKVAAPETASWAAVDGLDARLTLADGGQRQAVLQAGQTGWLELPPGSHRVTVSYQGQEIQRRVQVEAGKVTVLETVLEPSPFTDVTGAHWAYDAVLSLSHDGVLEGDPGGLFRPDRATTRAESVAVLVRGLGLVEGDGGTDEPFTDTADPSLWYHDLLVEARAAGLVRGDGSGRFHPERPITREEVVALLIRALALEDAANTRSPQQVQQLLSPYLDHAEAADWTLASWAEAVEQGLVEGRPGPRLAPAQHVPRAEVATLVHRAITRFR